MILHLVSAGAAQCRTGFLMFARGGGDGYVLTCFVKLPINRRVVTTKVG